MPNHTLFIDHLEYAYAMSKRHNKAMAVINLDIDKFSEINRHYGYKKGDTLIIDIATRLRDLVRESDTVSRLGGSEFGLIMSMIEQEEEKMEEALQNLTRNMEHEISRWAMTKSEMKSILSRIKWSMDMKQVKEADFIIEAVDEIFELKKKVFQELILDGL